MYAITASGWRAVGLADVLAPGESLVNELPAALVRIARSSQMRSARSALLRSTDWTQAPDSPLGVTDRQAWASYRAALRSLPQQPGFPDVEWPQPPNLADGAADVPITNK